MLRKLRIPLTLTWLTVMFVIPMPLLVLLTNGLSPLYADSALAIQSGMIAYCWMLTAVILSTRPHWLDRLIGLPNIYMIHGILSLGAILLAALHRNALPSSGIIALTGNAAFWIFISMAVWSMVFMAGWLTTRVPLLARVKNAVERVFKHEFSVWLHRLNLVAVTLIFIHVQLIPIVNTIRPFMIAFDAFSALAAVLYIRAKLVQRFGAHRGKVEAFHTIAPGSWKSTFICPDSKLHGKPAISPSSVSPEYEAFANTIHSPSSTCRPGTHDCVSLYAATEISPARCPRNSPRARRSKCCRPSVDTNVFSMSAMRHGRW